MGAGPSGLAGMNIYTGEIKYVISVPFQVGHIQTNPWVPDEIVFAGKPAANHRSGPGPFYLMVPACAHCIPNLNMNG